MHFRFPHSLDSVNTNTHMNIIVMGFNDQHDVTSTLQRSIDIGQLAATQANLVFGVKSLSISRSVQAMTIL